MSKFAGFSVLNNVAKALQSQFIVALASAPDVQFEVTDANLVLSPPGAELADETVATLYLYHLDVSPYSRNRKLIPDAADPNMMTKPPLPLQLRFLFTPVQSEDKNQLLLGRILQHFHDFPTFFPTLESSSIRGSEETEVAEEIRVRYDFASYQDQAQLWSGFFQPYRLSAGFLVDVVTLDSGKAAIQVPRVEAALGVIESKKQKQTS